MNIIIKNHFLLYKSYKLKCSIGKSGFTNFKKEGDLATPKGLFRLGLLYYRKDRVKLAKCKIKKKVIKKNMGWCDDIKSKKYNKEISFPFKHNAEKLYRKDNIYDIFINIKYNHFPIIKGKGSAIFLHLFNKKYKSTNGCIALEKKIKRNNLELQLSEKEIDFLILFSKSKNPINRNLVLKNVWKYSKESETHTVETHIHRLRKKILKKFGDKNFIKNNDKGYYI